MDEVELFDLDNPPDWAREDTEDEKPGDGEDEEDDSA